MATVHMDTNLKLCSACCFTAQNDPEPDEQGELLLVDSTEVNQSNYSLSPFVYGVLVCMVLYGPTSLHPFRFSYHVSDISSTEGYHF